MHYVISTVIARPSALKSRIKPTNVCSSAVRDLQTIRFGACEVYAGDFSMGRHTVRTNRHRL